MKITMKITETVLVGLDDGDGDGDGSIGRNDDGGDGGSDDNGFGDSNYVVEGSDSCQGYRNYNYDGNGDGDRRM